MKQSLLSIVCLLAVLGLSSCKKSLSEANYGETAKMESIDVVPPPPVALQGEQDKLSESTGNEIPESAIDRKIIKDGSMEVKVNNLADGKKSIDTLITRYKAYYSNETFNNIEYSRGFTLIIRIPSQRFDSFIAELESGLGEVVFKSISSRDVTEEFIDMETRLANKRNYLNRYADLLKQAKSVKDILEIQEKTRLIEEEMESIQGRLKYLNNQINYSTLNLQISKKNDYNLYNRNTGNFFDRLKISLVKGWFGLVSFTLFLIRIWPFWIILVVLYYAYKKIRLRKRK